MRLDALIVSLVSSAACVAQTSNSFVLPAGSSNSNTDAYESYLVTDPANLPVRIQSIYNASEFTKTAGTLTQIAFRRNNYYGNVMPAGTLTLTVSIGYAKNDASGASTTFASNLAVNVRQFFQGTVKWPEVKWSSQPAAFTHVIKPASPFVFVPSSVPGGSICVEKQITASTYGANRTYVIDAAVKDLGKKLSNGSSPSNCKFSSGSYNSGLSYTTGGLLARGGNWYVEYRNLLAGVPGVATLSFFGTKNSGSWPLPIDLTGIGAPGCAWNVGLETGFWVPVVADAKGRARWPTLTIPKSRGGWRFYDQAIFVDAGANAAGLVVSQSGEWYVGTELGPRGATIYRYQYNNETAGYMRPYETVTICEFTY